MLLAPYINNVNVFDSNLLFKMIFDGGCCVMMKSGLSTPSQEEHTLLKAASASYSPNYLRMVAHHHMAARTRYANLKAIFAIRRQSEEISRKQEAQADAARRQTPLQAPPQHNAWDMYGWDADGLPACMEKRFCGR
jgi:hypothetical protein